MKSETAFLIDTIPKIEALDDYASLKLLDEEHDGRVWDHSKTLWQECARRNLSIVMTAIVDKQGSIIGMEVERHPGDKAKRRILV